ncbi:hypothetical protein HETIRDRAFT_329475 [Heterobasidion irregulare TC 32-1]|uniref:Uncharacterized protein n=1 Tax=Heterobasidion irregulare (strain TC 32-1) TaxID=747525 RepID=W4JT98_HETIT|nr:uncharacterized protein HETIRDRAFT_329475 [Heterobasidion irregulare TC 32-1]ETW76116.1 hypothetical protein HETIRDRAFT_329475 [Heterobasidion irregulare TC 32-1]
MALMPKRPHKRKSKAAASVRLPPQPPPLITPAPVAPLLGHIPHLLTPSAFSQDTRMYGNPNIKLTPSQPYVVPSQHQHGFDDLSIDPALQAGEQQLAPTLHQDRYVSLGSYCCVVCFGSQTIFPLKQFC